MRKLMGPAATLIMASHLMGTMTMAADNVTPIKEDIFTVTPEAAKPDVRGPCVVAKSYVDLIDTQRFSEIGDLFTEDAVFVAPNGRILRGQAEIGKFYGTFMSQLRPQSIPLSFIADRQECVMELASRALNAEHYILVAIDHFTVNDAGKIARMIVFIRPQVVKTATAVGR